jgi:hypothetical protein
MSVLVIEVRAESFFTHCCQLLRDPDLFTGRRAEAEHAAEIVERVRQDEAIHVRYLQVFLSELRQFTFGSVKGATFLDPIWDRVCGFVQPERQRAIYDAIRAEAEQKLGADKAKRFMAQFDAFETGPALAVA